MAARPPPSLEDVAKYLKIIVEKLSGEILFATAETQGRCQILVFGLCPSLRHFSAYGVTVLAKPFSVMMEEVDVSPGRVAAIGQTDLFFERINSPVYAGSCWDVMQSLIADPTIPDVGGRLQACLVDKWGNARLVPVLTPVDDTENDARLSMAGFDLDGLAALGGYLVGYDALGPIRSK